MFTNLSVSLEELPSALPQQLLDVENRYAWIGGAVTLSSGVGLIALLFFWSQLGRAEAAERLASGLSLWLPLLVGLVVALSVVVVMARKRVRFALREHDLVLERGLFFRSQTIQPLRRLQHVSLQQGPIEKAANLASLSVYSAGSAVSTFSIPGLCRTTAERLRDQALAYQNRA